MQYTKRKLTNQMQCRSAAKWSASNFCVAMQKLEFVNLSVRETGFHVRVNYPFPGVLRDGIVSCGCHAQKTLWIKWSSKCEGGFRNWKNDKDFRLAKNYSLKTSHECCFQVQLQIFVCKFSITKFPYSLLMLTVKSNKDFIEKNAKSWQYFELLILSILLICYQNY